MTSRIRRVSLTTVTLTAALLVIATGAWSFTDSNADMKAQSLDAGPRSTQSLLARWAPVSVRAQDAMAPAFARPPGPTRPAVAPRAAVKPG